MKLIQGALLFLGSLLWCTAVTAGPESIRPGDPLRAALDQFDINIISSSRVLPWRLKVHQAPDPEQDEYAQIEALLAYHDLSLIAVDEQTAYVAKAALTVAVSNASAVPSTELPPMEELIVTEPYRLVKVRAPQTSLSAEVLDSLPGVAGDLFQGLQSVSAIAADGVSARHYIRGSGSNEVGYRVDGVNLFEPFHFRDAQGLFGAINPHVVEAADVYITALPLGSGERLSGLIDLHLLEAAKPFEGHIDLNSVAISANLRGYRGDWQYLVSSRKSVINSTMEWINLNADVEVPSFRDSLLRLNWAGANSEFVFGLMHNDESLRVENEASEEQGSGSYRYRGAWTRFDQKFSDRLLMRWRLSHIRMNRSREGVLADEANAQGQLTGRQDYQITQLNSDWHAVDKCDNNWRFGFSFTREQGDFQSQLTTQYGVLGQALQGQALRNQQYHLNETLKRLAVYGGYSRNLGAGFDLDLGLKWIKQSPTGGSDQAWDLRLGLVYQLSNDGLIKFDFGRYSQYQYLHELALEDGQIELNDFQHADQLNLGFEYRLMHDIQLRSDLYIKRVDHGWRRFDSVYNPTVLFPELHGDRLAIQPSKAEIQGFELQIGNQGQGFRWQLNYASNRSRERSNFGTHARPWDQPKLIKLSLGWQGVSYSMGLDGVYRSGWRVSNLGLTGGLYKARLPSYQSLNVFLKREFALGPGQMALRLDILNLADRRNVGGYRYDALGSADAQHLLGRVPSLSLSYGF